MSQGYYRAPDILPFDHRGSFEFRLYGWMLPLGVAPD
jgi:hypothetical protein